MTMDITEDFELEIGTANDEIIRIYRDQPLSLLHSEVNIMWLRDDLKKLIWQYNRTISVVYLANYSKYDSLFIYMGMGATDLYTEIRILNSLN